MGWNGYQAALGVLERHYNLILSDTGTGIIDDATQGILNRADQIVLCASASIDGWRASSLTLRRLAVMVAPRWAWVAGGAAWLVTKGPCTR
jgi:MinD-like ATPase involved in chromosome partitioning or flagellar assembly